MTKTPIDAFELEKHVVLVVTSLVPSAGEYIANDDLIKRVQDSYGVRPACTIHREDLLVIVPQV